MSNRHKTEATIMWEGMSEGGKTAAKNALGEITQHELDCFLKVLQGSEDPDAKWATEIFKSWFSQTDTNKYAALRYIEEILV